MISSFVFRSLVVVSALVLTSHSAGAKPKPQQGRPLQFKSDPLPVIVEANKPFSLNMRDFVVNPPADTLLWSTFPADKPAFVSINGDNLVGNPTFANIGTHRFRLAVKPPNDTGTIGRIDLIVRVTPVWNTTNLNLGTQPEDSAFNFDLKTVVTNPGPGALTFSATGLPPWMQMSTAGVLTGTPRRPHVGDYTGIVFTAQTESGGTATVNAFGKVTKTIHPPAFKSDVFSLPNATEDILYLQSVAGQTFVDNFEAAPLTFKIIEGAPPSGWLPMTPAGLLSGTPRRPDVGPVSLRVELTGTVDGQTFTSRARFNFTVIKVNKPPVWTSDPIILASAFSKVAYQKDLSPFATDIDADPLTFKLIDGPGWATLSTVGLFGGTPTNANLGLNEWTVEVSDGKLQARAKVQVVVFNRPPAWSLKPTVLPGTPEEVAYSKDLKAYVVDPEGDTLTFTKLDGPAWATLTPEGVISGTPLRPDVGVNVFTVRVADPFGNSDETEVQITVTKVNKKPIWSANPVKLPNTPENVAYLQNLKPFASDPDGDVLTFEKVSGPDWITISATGQLSGTPHRPQVGLNTVRVRVKDPGGLEALTDVEVIVDRVNVKPRWTQNPVPLPDGVEDKPFTFSLAPFAVDDDGDPLTFSKISGPAWMTVAANGAITGTPPQGATGPYTAVFEVRDAEDSAQAGGVGKVVLKNYPPKLKVENLVFTVKERSTFQVSLNQAQYVTDPNGDILSFALVDTLDFASITPTGGLTLRPVFKDIGDHDVRVRVTDGVLSDTATMKIKVIRDPRPPQWLENPITFTTLSRVPFTAKITDKAKDLDGLALTFSKKDGPAWLSIDAAGNLSGTPGDEQVGDNSFTVTVSNDATGADATLIVKVTKKNYPPEIKADALAFTIKERATFDVQLNQKQFVEDKDGDPLTFTLIDVAPWISLAEDGSFQAKPLFPQIGTHQFKVRVTDGKDAVQGVIKLTVVRDPRAPVWKQDPILFDAKARLPFAANIADKAMDLDGLPISFTKKSGPDWLSVSPAGQLSGIPPDSALGDNLFLVTVKNDALGSDATIKIRVLKNNRPPEIKQQNLTFRIKERQNFQVSLNQVQYVSDPDGDPLTFTLIETAPWIGLDGAGQFTATPKFKDIGTHAFRFRASDGEAAVEGVLNVIVDRDPRPPVWAQNPIRYETKARVAFSAKLSDKVQDLDGLPLTFTKKSGPAWLVVDANGTISGTPQDSDLGDNPFVVTARNDLAGADVDVVIKVLFNNKAPFWTENPVVLPNGVSGMAFNQTLAPFAKDPDPADVLKFTKTGGPTWLQLDPSGVLTGTPGPGDIGPVSFEATVTDPEGLFAKTTVKFTVEKPNAPPKWLQDPINLPDAVADTGFQFDLKPLATDPDGDPLTFRKINGPGWMFVGSNGSVAGVPLTADIGDYTATFAVTDGKVEVMVQAKGKVLKKNHPPVIKQANLAFTIKERSTFNVALNQSQYVEDLDGDTLTFTLTDSFDWITMGSDGAFQAKPLFKHIGDHAIKFSVSDGKVSVDGVLQLKVIRDPRPPIWLQNPLVFQATARIPFSADIKAKAQDLDNLPLTFTKKAGPSWLSITSTGLMTGTPQDENLGENGFVITVSNDALGADVNVAVTVVFNNHAPYWTENPIKLPNATTGVPYVQNVSAFAKDPDPADVLSFEKVTGPAWVVVGTKGEITGTPPATPVGPTSFQVKVKDPAGLFAIATVNLTVEKANNAPKWLQDPILLGNALVDKDFAFDLKSVAFDEDGDPLTFKKISGPDWLVVAPNGAISGIPFKANLGEFTAVFEVSDGKAAVKAGAKGTVIRENKPPVIKQANLNFTIKERQDFKVSINQPIYVEDPDGDPLTFTLLEVVDWVSLSGAGDFNARPQFKNIGQHALRFKATDGIDVVEGTINLKVIRDPRAPVWSQNPIVFETPARVPFVATLAGKAQDLDGLPLTFSKRTGPAWLNVDSDGRLSGTPQDENLGDNTFAVTVRNDLLGADATLVVKVIFSNHAPYWTENPVILPAATAGVAYSQTVAPFAKDPDPADVLAFSKVSGPDWITVGPKGAITGTPPLDAVGTTVSFEVKVTDPANLSATATVKFDVKKANTPPRWTQNPILLSDATEDKDYRFDLRPLAVDDDGDPLTFTKIAGPNWLTTGTNGLLGGKPATADVGDYTAIFEVSDGKGGTARADAKGRVLKKNQPPVINDKALVFTVKEREVLTVDLANAKYVVDPEGDALTFTMIDIADWVALTSPGLLSARPLFKQIGEHKLKFRVSDGTSFSEATMTIRVLRNPRAPEWSENPIVFNTKAREPFSATVADKVKDLDGLPLTITKKSGPAWLTVAPDGKLSGTPQDADLGDNNFVLTATNDVLGADVNLIIRVQFNNHAPYWIQDPVLLPGGQAGTAYTASVAPFAKDPDPTDVLTFSKVSGPGWVTVGLDGKITGTPNKEDVGTTSFQVRVSDPAGLFAIATVKIEIEKANSPPKWTQDPVRLADATQDTPYTFDLKPFVVDPDGDKLTFTKIVGPEWLLVAPDGMLSGTPKRPDVGDYTAVFEVTDGKAKVQVSALGRVLPKTTPPTINGDALVFTVKERATLVENLNQAKYVNNPDGTPLTFALLENSDFVTLSTTGELTLKPLFKHIGDHQVKFKVSSGTAIVEGLLKIKVLRDPRPPEWIENPIRFTAKAKVAFTATLANKAKDLDNLPLTFSKKEGPGWLNVAPNGDLTGTPAQLDIGDNIFIVSVKNDLLSADATLIITVLGNNNPPFWTKDPILLPDGKETVSYVQNIANFAQDPDIGDVLTFRKLQGPDWVFVTNAGVVIGTPPKGSAGVVTLRVRVQDPQGAFADATVQFTVTPANRPPRWLKDPIPLGDARVGIPFTFDLAPLAVDDDGDPLTFKKVNGPGWLQVALNGKITGTPALTDLGQYTATFSASDGSLVTLVSAYGQVLNIGNQPPVITKELKFIVKEGTTFTENLNQPKYIYDPDGDPITIEITAPPAWVTLTPQGALTLKPLRPQVGDHVFAIKATDSKGNSTTGPMFVKVLKDPKPPKWLQDPIRFEAKVNVPFAATLADKVENSQGDQLTFTKKSGPGWLVVGTDGKLSGTPLLANLGENSFLVTATNGVGSADVTVIINVIKTETPITDTIAVDEQVPGAPSEQLWVIDNSCGSPKLVNALYNQVDAFSTAVNNAKLHHTGVYVASDVWKFKARPITDNDGSDLFTWKDSDWVTSFQQRIRKAQGNYCYNSPVWAMFKFYEQAHDFSFFQKEYFMPGVPMDVLIVTTHTDRYKWYAQNTEQAGWKVEEYGDHYIEFHKNTTKQPYRISVIGPECPKLSVPAGDKDGLKQFGKNNPYRILSDQTSGDYFPVKCDFDLDAALKKYAQKVIFRAYVYGKGRVKLSKKPVDPAAIVVKLAGVPLDKSKWSYDSSSNEIVIQWLSIDVNALKPGDKIEIEYKTNEAKPKLALR